MFLIGLFKILFNTLFNEDSGNVIFNCNGMDILDIDLNRINLDNTNSGKDDPDTGILVKFLGWHKTSRSSLSFQLADLLLLFIYFLESFLLDLKQIFSKLYDKNGKIFKLIILQGYFSSDQYSFLCVPLNLHCLVSMTKNQVYEKLSSQQIK